MRRVDKLSVTVEPMRYREMDGVAVLIRTEVAGSSFNSRAELLEADDFMPKFDFLLGMAADEIRRLVEEKFPLEERP